MLRSADFVLCAGLSVDGSLAAFDGSTPTRLVVGQPDDDGREVGSFDLVAESGATWISDTRVVVSANEFAAPADLYDIDIDAGEAVNLTNTPNVFESTPTLVDGAGSHPTIAYAAAPILGHSDVPEYGPDAVEVADVDDDHLNDGTTNSLDVHAVDDLTLASVRGCPSGAASWRKASPTNGTATRCGALVPRPDG